MFKTTSALAVLLLATGFATAQPTVAPKVQVVGFSIHKPHRAFVNDKEDDKLIAFMRYTEIGVVISMPGTYILEARRGKLTSFTDDKGTDLIKKEEPPPDSFIGMTAGGAFFRTWWQGIWSDIPVSKDGGHFGMEVRGGNTPAVGATKIKLKADVEVTCGLDEKTVELKNVKIDANLDAAIGPFILRWNKESSENEARLTFSWKQAKAIKSVVFLTASGVEIKATKSNSGGFGGGGGGGKGGGGGIKGGGGLFKVGTLGFGGSGPTPQTTRTEQAHYSLTVPGEPCTVRVTFFDNLETVTVPINVEVGVGF